MRRKRDSQRNNNKNIIIKLDECKFIRQSGNTSVYLMKNNNAVKIFQDPAECKSEYNLLKVIDNPYFPKVFRFCGHYFIREYVYCTNIIKYISINGVNNDLFINLIKLMEELKKFSFINFDITFNDIFIKKDLEFILLNVKKSSDPTKLYQNISKDLGNLGLLEKFLEVLKNYDESLYESWTKI